MYLRRMLCHVNGIWSKALNLALFNVLFMILKSQKLSLNYLQMFSCSIHRNNWGRGEGAWALRPSPVRLDLIWNNLLCRKRCLTLEKYHRAIKLPRFWHVQLVLFMYASVLFQNVAGNQVRSKSKMVQI